jgi:hypothetical protein
MNRGGAERSDEKKETVKSWEGRKKNAEDFVES